MEVQEVELQRMEVIDLPAVALLEQDSYPADEAASRQVLDYRINYARDLCYVVHLGDAMLGYVVGTGASSDTKRLHAHHMKNHYQGNVLCIHSVVIAPAFRRKGYGSKMLQLYLAKVQRDTHMTRALLLAKKHLLPFYQRAGFRVVGPSDVAHGKDTWYEMELVFE